MVRSLFSATAERIAEGLDRAFASVAIAPRGPTRQREHAELLAGLELVAGFYDRPEHYAQAGGFFPVPAPIEPEVRHVRSFGRDGDVLDLQWPSEFVPIWSDAEAAALAMEAAAVQAESAGARGARGHVRTVREKYLDVTANATAAARWFRHRSGPRPCAVLLHGYMGGTLGLEERMFPVRKLFAGGMDVVLSVLPFHGSRRDERRGLRAPAFPSSDPRFTIEGFRQVVFDQRALFDYLERQGCSAIGVMGTSLGGYASALLATLEARLQFAVLFIPLGSLEQFYADHGAIPGAESQRVEIAALLRRAHRAVNPCARPSLLPSERVRVIAGMLDRVTGLS